MESILFKILSFIVAVGVLVAIHEFGHFWVARRLGVKVLKFSIGFGRPLWKRTAKDGVEYVIAAIPLGGYVKMLGENDKDVPQSEMAQAFYNQSLPVRSAIVAAGPIFNFIFAIIAFWLVLMLGENGLRPLVGEVTENSHAAVAGFQEGEEIRSLNGKETRTWTAVMYELASASVTDKPLHFKVMDDRHDLHDRQVPAGVMGDPAETEDLLGVLGIKPAKPKIPAVIGEVVAGQPAEEAGLQPGDEVIEADGQLVEEWFQWVEMVKARPGMAIPIVINRDAVELNLTVTPAVVAQEDKFIGRIGAKVKVPDGLFDEYEVVYKLEPLEAIPAAFARTWEFSILTLKVLGRMLIGDVSVKNLSGPISIADIAGKTASIGIVPFIKFLAIVSISLGVLNLLPIPVLDGGHLFFFMLEAIKGSPLSDSFIEKGQRVGMSIMLMLIGIALFVDVSRYLL